MKISETTLIEASSDDTFSFLLSESYTRLLVQHIDVVHDIEEIARAQEDGEVITRVMRYSASTRDKVPKFLKKYEASAPEYVYWKQIERWDRARARMTYTIEAEIKDEWQRYYETRGVLMLEKVGEQKTRQVTELDYQVKVFGLGSLIERALRDEISKLLAIQGQLAANHFSVQG